MTESWEQVTRLFGAARVLTVDARAAFLDAACAGDPELRSQIEHLLAYDSRTDSFLAEPPWTSVRAADIAWCLSPGEVLNGRYRIECGVATGGQAFVYRANDLVLSRPVIVKVMRGSGRHNRLLRQRFEQEMTALSRVDHPGVVGILDVGELSDGCPFLVIQYVNGVSLREALHTGPLDPQRTGRFLRELGSALSSAHAAGVAHRDLKPENIMVQRLADGTESLKLIDFGISKIDRPELEPALTGVMVAGTVRYMAPEQFQGVNSPASDAYALALVACEMLSGQPDIRALPKDVNVRARRLIHAALAFDAAERPRDVRRWCQQVADALDEGRTHGRWFAAVLAALVLVAAAATLTTGYLPLRAAEPRRIIEKVGAFDPVAEGFGIHNDIRGTVADNPRHNGYDGWRVFTERQGHYFKDLTGVEKRLALERGWRLVAAMRVEEGTCFAVVDFAGVGKRFQLAVHRAGANDLVRLYTQIVPTFQGLDLSIPRTDGYHTYELRYDPGLQTADLWVDDTKRIEGYRGHSQFQGDGDVMFGVGVFESARGVASFQNVRFEINP